MNDALGTVVLPRSTKTYSANELDNILFLITQQLQRILNKGRVLGDVAILDNLTIGDNGNFNVASLPTSSVGLSSGDVWHDTTSNTLKVVP